MTISPDPRYYRDGNGLKPRLRLWLRHPIWCLRFTPLQRLRVRWNDRRRRRIPAAPEGRSRFVDYPKKPE